MMHVAKEFPYAALNDAKALEIPYSGEHISMLLLLPNKREGLRNFEQNLNSETITEIRKKLSKTKVNVKLPKFKINYSRELASALKVIGADIIFKTNKTDFSAATDKYKGMCVAQILHKTIIEVNEKGTEVAGATATAVENTDATLIAEHPSMDKFNVEHPFLMAIVEKTSDMILFIGRVNNL